jgi:RhoGAP domain/Divergent CRAL/TRIO domain/Calponin homology (CH) domain
VVLCLDSHLTNQLFPNVHPISIYLPTAPPPPPLLVSLSPSPPSLHKGSFTLRRTDARREETRVLTLEVASWFASVLECKDSGTNFIHTEEIQAGLRLCELIRKIDPVSPSVASIHANATPGSFHARDNIKKFMDASLEIGVPQFRSFEVEDWVAKRNLRGIMYFVLNLAREAFLKYGITPPQIVAMELEIDELMLDETVIPDHLKNVVPSMDHEHSTPEEESDEIEVWLADYINEHKVPQMATPSRVTKGQYIFAADPEPQQMHYVRMVRGVPLVRSGDDWEEFANLIQRKMRAAFKSSANPIIGTPISEEEDPLNQPAADDSKHAAVSVPEVKEEELHAEPARSDGSPVLLLGKDKDIVEEARKMDHTHVALARVIYYAGEDHEGRGIIVIIGRRIPPLTDIRLYHLLMYAVYLLDQHGRTDYVAVYAHSNASLTVKLFSWLRQARSRLPKAFKKNLKALYIVHPSFFIKTLFVFFRPAISSKFWHKIKYFSSAQTFELAKEIGTVAVEKLLPAFVMLQTVKSKKKISLFESNLQNGLERNPVSYMTVPRIVHECMEYLEIRGAKAEGVFRVSGSHTEIKRILRSYDKDDDAALFSLMRNDESVHAVAGVLKSYLRTLSDPVIPFVKYEEFMSVHNVLPPPSSAADDAKDNSPAADSESDESKGVEQLQQLFNSMPDVNQFVLGMLMRFCHTLIKNKATTKMTPKSLSIVFAPTLARTQNESGATLGADSPKRARIIQTMITNSETLFPHAPTVYAEPEDDHK